MTTLQRPKTPFAGNGLSRTAMLFKIATLAGPRCPRATATPHMTPSTTPDGRPGTRGTQWGGWRGVKKTKIKGLTD